MKHRFLFTTNTLNDFFIRHCYNLNSSIIKSFEVFNFSFTDLAQNSRFRRNQWQLSSLANLNIYITLNYCTIQVSCTQQWLTPHAAHSGLPLYSFLFLVPNVPFRIRRCNKNSISFQQIQTTRVSLVAE